MVLRIPQFLILSFVLFSCAEGTDKEQPDSKISLGEDLYNNNCAACHGLDGKLGAGGATDLSASSLTKDEMEDVVEKGRGGMPPQGHVFTNKNEVGEVIDFVLTLK